MKRNELLTVCVLSSVLGKMYGYSSGVPPDQCEQMTPSHGVAAQTGPSPYTIYLSPSTFSCPGQDITVTINGTSTFKGFLCQPRPDPNNYNTSGSLSATGNTQVKNNCGTNAALTHVDNSPKAGVSFVWKAANDNTSVHIICTIVQSYDTLWVKTTSATVSYAAGQCPGDTSGTLKTISNLPIYIVVVVFVLHFK